MREDLNKYYRLCRLEYVPMMSSDNWESGEANNAYRLRSHKGEEPRLQKARIRYHIFSRFSFIADMSKHRSVRRR